MQVVADVVALRVLLQRKAQVIFQGIYGSARTKQSVLPRAPTLRSPLILLPAAVVAISCSQRRQGERDTSFTCKPYNPKP